MLRPLSYLFALTLAAAPAFAAQPPSAPPSAAQLHDQDAQMIIQLLSKMLSAREQQIEAISKKAGDTEAYWGKWLGRAPK